nr:MAG TPA: hypothetical protein [Crassvirales sp.]
MVFRGLVRLTMLLVAMLLSICSSSRLLMNLNTVLIVFPLSLSVAVLMVKVWISSGLI